MKCLTYPVLIEEAAPADFVASFPDIPEAVTGAASREEALALAADALAVAVEGYLELGRPVPSSSEREDLPHVALDPAVAARLALVQAMAREGLTKVALAARMHRDEKVVRRILAGKNVSLDLTLEALRALGVRPALAI
jgi:antitoxin HicB